MSRRRITAQLIKSYEYLEEGIPVSTLDVEIKGLRQGRETLAQDVLNALRYTPDGLPTLDRKQIAQQWGNLNILLSYKR